MKYSTAIREGARLSSSSSLVLPLISTAVTIYSSPQFLGEKKDMENDR
jgi:hypothetical protein